MNKEVSVLIVSCCATERSKAIAEATGYRVVGEASTATEGLEMFFRHSPDVVLLDIWLPDANGFRVLEQIRAAHPDCAVVMMGISQDGLIREACSLFGATALFKRSNERMPIAGILRRIQPTGSAWKIAVDPTEPEIAPSNFNFLHWP